MEGSEGVSGYREPRAGVGLSWVVVEVRPFPGKGWIPGVFEKVRGRLYLPRKKKIRLQKAHVLEGLSWPLVVKRYGSNVCSAPPQLGDPGAPLPNLSLVSEQRGDHI